MGGTCVNHEPLGYDLVCRAAIGAILDETVFVHFVKSEAQWNEVSRAFTERAAAINRRAVAAVDGRRRCGDASSFGTSSAETASGDNACPAALLPAPLNSKLLRGRKGAV